MHEPNQDTSEIIIVGGGIVGLLIGRELLQRGHAVRVLDAGDGRETASCGNAGIIAGPSTDRQPSTARTGRRTAAGSRQPALHPTPT